jgi:hypothetical protein
MKYSRRKSVLQPSPPTQGLPMGLCMPPVDRQIVCHHVSAVQQVVLEYPFPGKATVPGQQAAASASTLLVSATWFMSRKMRSTLDW